jgi:hypothetical protein
MAFRKPPQETPASGSNATAENRNSSTTSNNMRSKHQDDQAISRLLAPGLEAIV